jgi:hypothetical protein
MPKYTIFYYAPTQTGEMQLSFGQQEGEDAREAADKFEKAMPEGSKAHVAGALPTFKEEEEEAYA